MAIDLNTLNPAQLHALINQAQVRQTELRREKITQLRQDIMQLLKEHDCSFEEVFGSAQSKPSRATGSVPPKYRNPQQPEQTWTGRGKRPRWFSAALDAGQQPQDLLI